jgi:hypothetical protein
VAAIAASIKLDVPLDQEIARAQATLERDLEK